MVVDYLGDNDMKVTALASGADIARVIGQQMIDLLILDLKMPGQNGMDIARRIRAESNMPIIMLTGCGRLPDEAVFAARTAGAHSRPVAQVARQRNGGGWVGENTRLPLRRLGIECPGTAPQVTAG
jgi:CheY-like chemotaxis protein